ncbi:MAG: hypothetical protein GY854_16415 [Deltaproteobacteria bacterium]|nr:hypothetical protein [Deltaproteobacteria bacterium]
MPDSLEVGKRIVHDDFGHGRVLALLRGGRIVRVEFDEMPGAPWDIPRNELSSSKPSTVAVSEKTASPTPLKNQPPSMEQREDRGEKRLEERTEGQDSRTARQALEALRLGVVPFDHLEIYTVGRDTELAAVSDMLHRSHGTQRLTVVLGDYGTGKTHFLELAERQALAAGFLVGGATMDSREVLPSRPRRIYHQLAAGLRYPDDPTGEQTGLAPLLDRALMDADLVQRWVSKKGEDYHPYLGPALAYWSALRDEDFDNMDLKERLLDWIQGAEVASNVELWEMLRRDTGLKVRGARMYAMQDYRTVTHIYTLILGGIAELARQAGYSGLLVTVDEAEFYSILSGRDRVLAEVLFKTFAASCLPRDRLLFDPASLPRGGAEVHRSFSYRHTDDQALHCIFALTHDPEGKALLEKSIPKDRFMELSAFDTGDYVTLSERVLELYCMAGVDLVLDSSMAPLMAEVIRPCHESGLIENPRQALKFITELVDLARYSPEKIRPILYDLVDRLKQLNAGRRAVP